MIKVSVIILNWNGAHLLKKFLPSVIKYSVSEYAEVIVADNASNDDSVEVVTNLFPTVKLMRFDKNYGFAGGYNKALKQVNSEFVVLLNSDVEVCENWLEPIIEMMSTDKRIAAVQPKILAYNQKSHFEYAGASGGYIDYLGYPFCRGRILDTIEEDKGQYNSVEDIFWCSGAAMFVRRQVYLDMEGLDEKFFAHMEEIDLCWRMRNAGYSLKVNPVSVVYHVGGASLPMNHPHKLYLNYRNNLLMLYKNLPQNKRFKIMSIRLFMDMASALVFTLKAEFANVRAVYSAYKDYHNMKSSYNIDCKGKNSAIPHMYKGSIIFAYFLKRIRKYSQLHNNNTQNTDK